MFGYPKDTTCESALYHFIDFVGSKPLTGWMLKKILGLIYFGSIVNKKLYQNSLTQKIKILVT